jgi:hypothetical protein
VNLAQLGTVRVSPWSPRNAVARGGQEITGRINESLAARVREVRAEWHRNADTMEGIARVRLAPSFAEWSRTGGTRSW